jgi:hypothetical protein
MADFTLKQEQYEALIFLARLGAGEDPQKLTQLDAFLKDIERSNGIVRSFLWVQWQELSAPLPQGTRFPDRWPPELRKAIELVSRPIAKADVEEVLDKFASEPTNVLVTRDPAALIGWTPIDDFFIT